MNNNIEDIRKAVWQTKKLQIIYTKYSGEETERIIRPYGLVVKKSEWDLSAYCEVKKQFTTYPVKIRLKEDNGDLLGEFEIMDTLRENRVCTYVVNMTNFDTAGTMLFPISDRLEIIEPVYLRDYIIDKARKILELNEK